MPVGQGTAAGGLTCTGAAQTKHVCGRDNVAARTRLSTERQSQTARGGIATPQVILAQAFNEGSEFEFPLRAKSTRLQVIFPAF